MIKYFKDNIGNYEYAEILQTVSLVLFVLFFTLLVWYVYSKPKGFYKKVSELPLEEDSNDLANNK